MLLRHGYVEEKPKKVEDTLGADIEPLETQSEELKKFIEEEKLLFPEREMYAIGAIVGVYILLQLVKGGKGVKSLIGIKECGISYQIFGFLMVAAAIVVVSEYAKILKEREYQKKQEGFDFKKYGQMMDDDMIKKSSFGAAIAGLIGGLLGLGGGVILTPLWLKMGFPNQRTSATATFTVVFTSFSSFFSNLLGGSYTASEIVFWGVSAFISSFLISRFLKFLVRKLNRESVLIAVLLFIITLAAIMLPVQSIFRIIDVPARLYTFGDFC